MASVAIVVVAAVLGLAVGSFLNVVVWRVPRGESLAHPASHCPTCNHAIRPWDNIPLLSWLLLRAKCRDCRSPISVRYPLVEAATGVFFAGIAWWVVSSGVVGGFAATASTIAMGLGLAAFLYLAAISIALALIDIETQRLPNIIVLPAYLVAAALLTASAIVGGRPEVMLMATIGMSALFAIYWVLAMIGGMGFGDVKLAGVLGLYLGFLGLGPLLVGSFAAFALGGIFGIAMLLARRGSRKTKIPFGPWMLAGAWVGIFIGDTLFSGYLGLFGLG